MSTREQTVEDVLHVLLERDGISYGDVYVRLQERGLQHSYGDVLTAIACLAMSARVSWCSEIKLTERGRKWAGRM